VEGCKKERSMPPSGASWSAPSSCFGASGFKYLPPLLFLRRRPTSLDDEGKGAVGVSKVIYRPQASVMQRQRQARPWAQATRREPKRAGRRIPEQALDAGPRVLRAEVRDQPLARIANVLSLKSGPAAARQCHDLPFLGEHLAQGAGGAVLMHVRHS